MSFHINLLGYMFQPFADDLIDLYKTMTATAELLFFGYVNE